MESFHFFESPLFLPQFKKQWQGLLEDEIKNNFEKNIWPFLLKEKEEGKTIFPSSQNLFKVFETLDYSEIKVVILGQDPYHNEGQATGLAFGVPNLFYPKPPSLKNIIKELETDLNIKVDSRKSDLSGWLNQGVFLLNTVLSVRKSEPLSHQDIGWEHFTDFVLNLLNGRKEPLVFILWGSSAQKKKSLISANHHKIIEAPHPSPLSAYRGFFGSKPFSKVNHFLEISKKTPIDWSIISQTTFL